MLNFNSIIMTSENPDTLEEFYNKVFGKKPDWKGGTYRGWLIGGGFVTLGFHDKVKGANQSPGRFMFNLETDDLAGDFERIKGVGAKVIAAPYHPKEDDKNPEEKIATFADPDGNYFQLMPPWKPS